VSSLEQIKALADRVDGDLPTHVDPLSGFQMYRLAMTRVERGILADALTVLYGDTLIRLTGLEAAMADLWTNAILLEIFSKEFKQKDIARSYALAIKSESEGRTVDWTKINGAILSRWSMSGLERIKKLAWDILAGKRPAALAAIGSLYATAMSTSKRGET
jgi:hypothetical protein